MRILLLGKHGQLGWELRRTLAPLGSVTALDFEDVDFVDAPALGRSVQELQPELIVNAAAYTDVDGAEQQRDTAFAINATAPQVLAERAEALGAFLIHYSTDYVFDGAKGDLYTEDDAPDPQNIYGASKLAGEVAIQGTGAAHLILRTAWVYSLRGNSFVRKVLQWARKHETLHIVDDQVSNPTWARMLAEVTAHVVARGHGYMRERGGLYHLAGSGHASRFEWAEEILELDPEREDQKATEVLRAATSDIPTPAQRPLFSALDCTRWASRFGLSLPAWEDALRLAMGRDGA